jgi:hypothetical protein
MRYSDLIKPGLFRRTMTQDAIGAKSLNLGSAEARTAYWHAYEREREQLYGWAAALIRKQFASERRQILYRFDAGWEAEGAIGVLDWHTTAWRGVLKRVGLRVGSVFAKRTTEGIEGGKSARQAIERWAAGNFSEIYRMHAGHKAIDDVWYDALLEYIDTLTGNRAVQILGHTKTLLKDAIREGMKNGEGVYEIRQRIDRLYLDQIIPHRSETIARTEVVSASGAGSRAAAQATGLKLEHEWISSRDDRVRETHQDADGQRKPLDEPFEVGGSLLMHPGDSSLGADGKELICCRCVEVYHTIR